MFGPVWDNFGAAPDGGRGCVREINFMSAGAREIAETDREGRPVGRRKDNFFIKKCFAGRHGGEGHSCVPAFLVWGGGGKWCVRGIKSCVRG